MAKHFERDYKQLLERCLIQGELCENRTDVKTYKLFNQSFNIDISENFPIVTAKKVNFKHALTEFMWMMSGDTSLKYLNDNGIKWWDGFAKDGQLGKVYGYQIRKFNGVFDQIEYAKKEILNNSRRAIITLWNPTDLEDQALPCCFTGFNFVRQGDKLNMAMDFRSSDMFLGLPYDIQVGALLLATMAKKTGLKPNLLGINLKDAHIYETHRKQVIEYCKRPNYILPVLTIDKGYELSEYKHGSFIKAELIN